MAETILNIARSIDARNRDENSNGYRNKAIARCLVNIESSRQFIGNGEYVFFLTNLEQLSGARESSSLGGMSIYKNTRLGEVLSKYSKGNHTYTVRTNIGLPNEVNVDIFNKATYSYLSRDVIKDLEIRLADDDCVYRYAFLSDLISQNKEAEEKLKKEREKMQQLQAENPSKEEENQQQAEIERIEREIEETNKRILAVKNFLRNGVELRSQHILDEFQETAKRSHLFDGTAVIIEGGPGTGKTTTVIQRLKFLLSKSALDEYENPLNDNQKAFLTDPHEYNKRWLFFSPTPLLLQYLRNNMIQEGLIADDLNTKTLDRYRTTKLREYGLVDPTRSNAFKSYRPQFGEEILVIKPERLIKDFEQFCISFIRNAMDQRVRLETSGFSWESTAISIKSTYQNMKVNDIAGLMRLINALCDRDRSNIKTIDAQLKELLDRESVRIKSAIMANETSISEINSLFLQWTADDAAMDEDDENDVITDEENDENNALAEFNQQNFEIQLFSSLKKLLRKLGLMQFDAKTKLSHRDNELYKIVEPYITENNNVHGIGELALFTKNFASMCRGLDSCLIRQIPRIYKVFRKKILANESDIYNINLLERVINRDNNKHLHPDEQNFIIGFLNNMFYDIYKQSKIRFDTLSNKFVNAYRESVRPVIGIDEATDYSLLDYYFMVSFRYYEFSSITLCGDIMQGLNNHGIRHWNDLKKPILPSSLEIMPLNISYRQLPTLVDLSKEMYKDDQGEYPSYKSEYSKSEDEPTPLMLISNDEDEKAEWISNRIVEIYRHYNQSLPSVAIFVGDDVNIPDFINRIVDLDILNGIDIKDCSGGNFEGKDVVRVFRLTQVKGMEFEAVFFYDIDKAISNNSPELIRRHIYVGVSRATSHLAVTMTSPIGNESISRYFNTNNTEWK